MNGYLVLKVTHSDKYEGVDKDIFFSKGANGLTITVGHTDNPGNPFTTYQIDYSHFDFLCDNTSLKNEEIRSLLDYVNSCPFFNSEV